MAERTSEQRITVAGTVEPDMAMAWWEFYRRAFAPLETRAVARQLLHEHEFLEEMSDPRVWKYLAHDEDDRLVGMSTLTNDLSTVPWISPAFFAHRYPEHTARNAVFYLGFTLVSAERRRERVFEAMISAIIDRVAQDRGVCGWDLCSFNVDQLGLAAGIAGLLRRTVDAEVPTVDTQTYYVADLDAALSKGAQP